SALQMLMMQPPKIWLSAVLRLIRVPMSCTATDLIILTIPVSVATDTSAIWTPPTPADMRPPGFLGSLTPISEIVFVPSLAQAAFQVRLLAELPLTWTLPSTASSCSLGTPSEGATASNSLSSAFTVALRVEEETPPIVVDPPEAPEGGSELSPITTLTAANGRPSVSAATILRQVRVP